MAADGFRLAVSPLGGSAFEDFSPPFRRTDWLPIHYSDDAIRRCDARMTGQPGETRFPRPLIESMRSFSSPFTRTIGPWGKDSRQKEPNRTQQRPAGLPGRLGGRWRRLCGNNLNLTELDLRDELVDRFLPAPMEFLMNVGRPDTLRNFIVPAMEVRLRVGRNDVSYWEGVAQYLSEAGIGRGFAFLNTAGTGSAEFQERFLRQADRRMPVMEMERSVYAEKTGAGGTGQAIQA
jgi:hypothetical protein